MPDKQGLRALAQAFDFYKRSPKRNPQDKDNKIKATTMLLCQQQRKWFYYKTILNSDIQDRIYKLQLAIDTINIHIQFSN